ncbi:ATP-dependent helicase [Aureibacter tunicatorum]|uniref:DNA 3'-5' helicase n=1 Tax=Aureibacter tunicatorum TaxID=866807 RepID=A0AAE3XQU5_9BACT|nr:UvrD-helicase domain-containing protein [Aureibacter tunicatorum]MDR6240922.1 DNA helicase-2/ATP-dependent DNA helicase PcrA [Aureibacter tunicatorum]BDD03702.1 DNA helicase [Aureibacter tunicatorum]
MSAEYLNGLNEPQLEGVVNTEGPTMIIAGAGSGKTKVLTSRIAYLINEQGVDPFNILALTFTNKAAKEMKDRIEAAIGTEARSLWMGTFHSIFAKILRFEAEKLGYTRDFTIYDTDDSKQLIKQIVKELGLDDKIYKPNVVLNRISGAKNRLISWQEYIQNPLFKADDEQAAKPKLGEIYKLYAQRCFKAGAMDFDDLLFNTNVLFKKHTDVLNKYQHRFKYVLVDEFQDTNISQYLITKKLSAVSQNLCVVGDDAQSIYAFRGANIDNILNLERDFPELKTIKLEQNYRSTKTIVNAANDVIKNNKSQIPKVVWTANTQGELIEVIRATSDTEEGKIVAQAIFEEKVRKQLHNQDFAVLYRTNSQSRAIEEALRRNNIKYKIVGGLSFYQRKEIKDLLAYFRVVINGNDEQSLRRIINQPKRSIGQTTVDKILVYSSENDLPLWEAVERHPLYLRGRASNAVGDFANMIKSFRIDAERNDAFEVAKRIAKDSGLLKHLYDDKSIEGLSRFENVQELINAVKEFIDNEENEDKSLTAFLQEVALLTGVDQDKDDDPDKVTLMTIHMAKGLEFKHVFLVGMEEELFPSQMMLNSREDLEEERRLFYVAITRAEQKLTLSYALSRYRFGRLIECEPSRFIKEIKPEYLALSNKKAKKTTTTTEPSTKFVNNLMNKGFKPSQATNKAKAVHNNPNFAPSDTSGLAEGQRVEHPKFGMGTVLNIDASGSSKKATIKFDQVGEKTLLLSFAKLQIHD